MTPTAVATDLTPVERLQLREKLQDLWRLQVRQITLLSLAMYDDLDAEEPTPVRRQAGATTEEALAEARQVLVDLEDAMRRLDEGGPVH
ncbi:MAG: hypothetical protein ACTHK4_16105 [Mycobacteriales bacterium]